MGKADELLRTAGGTIAESARHRGAPVAMPGIGPSLGSDRLAGIVRSKAALEIPVDRIERDLSQPREEFDADALARLADSIRGRGILQPIRVRWDEDKARYVIISGERRWRASQMAGVGTIPCVVDDRPLEPGEVLADQLVENCLREDLGPVEQAKAFRTLMSLNGWSGNQLAKELGISQPAVVQALALLKLPKPVVLAVDSGALSASTAYAIAALPDAGDQAEVAARAVAEKMSRAEVAAEVRFRTPRATTRNKKGKPAKPRKVTSRTLRTPGGPKVTVEFGRGLDLEIIRIALVAALELVNREAGRSNSAA